jgi:hypothetical protein
MITAENLIGALASVVHSRTAYSPGKLVQVNNLALSLGVTLTPGAPPFTRARRPMAVPGRNQMY